MRPGAAAGESRLDILTWRAEISLIAPTAAASRRWPLQELGGGPGAKSAHRAYRRLVTNPSRILPGARVACGLIVAVAAVLALFALPAWAERGCGSDCVTPNQPPTALFSTAANPAVGAPVSFDASASNDELDSGGIATYAWSFGDGATQTPGSPTTTHIYSAPGTYTVSLTVTDDDATGTTTTTRAQTSTISHSITVSPSASVSVAPGEGATSGSLSYIAGPGGANDVTLSHIDGGVTSCDGSEFICFPQFYAGTVTVTDTGAVLRPGVGCASNDAHSVTCGTGVFGLADMSFATGDGNDHVDLTGAPASSATIDGGTGADVIHGGPGQTTIDYSSRSAPVTVDLGAGSGGETGEGDTLTGIQNVRGGSGNDHLTGSSGDNRIDGGPGNDAITGGGGTDTVDYSARSAAVSVNLSGGAGTGGEAGESDTLTGIANVLGGSGNDTIGTRDTTADYVSCGSGTDHLTADDSDSAGADCEQVDIPVRNTSLPTVTGTARDGQTLTAGHGSWNGTPAPTHQYQWRRCTGAGTGCADIQGATSGTYLLGHDDAGRYILVRDTATNASSSATAQSASTAQVAAAAPVNGSLPQISGPAQEASTLTTGNGSWSGTPATYAYQWRRCDADGLGCADIPLATSATYVPTHDDVGHRLRMHLTATNAAAPAGVAVNSDPTGSIQPLPATTNGSSSSAASNSQSSGAPGSGSPSGTPGSASTPAQPAAAPLVLGVKLPKQKLAQVLKKGLRASVSCSLSCSFKSQLLLDAKSAKRLHLAAKGKQVSLGRASGATAANGRTTVTIKLSAKAKRALKRARSVKLKLSTVPAGGPPVVTTASLRR